jgi:transposase-like protein
MLLVPCMPGSWAHVSPGVHLYAGQSPDVKQQIVEMAMNASGIRDMAWVLHMSPTTVLKELKKPQF